MNYLWILTLIVCWHECKAADNLALLSGTLRTYQQAGCDDEVVSLKCPTGTTISVEVAQYGKYASTKHLCPGKLPPGEDLQHTTTCLWPNALQYSLLQTVVEACQKKSTCQFQASPATFEGDPCPGERKYVEVAYKCRPYIFRSQVACENERIQLQCDPNLRVAIYSANYGRTDYESHTCPQPAGVAEEICMVSYATETVMQICHGKRRCEISADASTFGNPCRPQTRMYLRIAYTCVPRKVLNKQYEEPLEQDEIDLNMDSTHDQDDVASFDSNAKLPELVTPQPKNVEFGSQGFNNTKIQKAFDSTKKTSSHRSKTPVNDAVNIQKVDLKSGSKGTAIYDSSRVFDHPQTDNTISVTSGQREQIIGFISAWINTYAYISKNPTRFYLYLLMSIGAAFVLFAGILTSRVLMRKRREKRAAQGHSDDIGDGSVAHGFVDDISEVDADIDLTPPSDVVMHTVYGGRLGSFASELPRSVNHHHPVASVYYYG